MSISSMTTSSTKNAYTFFVEDVVITSRAVTVERIVHKSYDFKSAAEWDIEQHVRMSPQERMRAARALKDRVYPPDAEDVRACHKTA